MPFLTSGRSRFIGGGRVPPTPVPVAGAEKVTNGSFETGDPPTGWGISGGSTLARIADTSIDGEYALNATRGSAVTSATQNITGLTNGGWYRAQTSMRVVTATLAYFSMDSFGDIGGANFTTTWAQRLLIARMTATSGAIRFYVDGAPGVEARADAVSFVPLTLSSLISVRPYASADCDISVAVTRTAGTQAGISARVDSASSPANFLIAYLDGAGNVKVDKAVSGTYTNVISGAVTYGAGYILRLVCNGNNVSCYYNGTQVGSTTAVADAGIVSNKNHGLFSTYASNSFSGYVAA